MGHVNSASCTALLVAQLLRALPSRLCIPPKVAYFLPLYCILVTCSLWCLVAFYHVHVCKCRIIAPCWSHLVPPCRHAKRPHHMSPQTTLPYPATPASLQALSLVVGSPTSPLFLWAAHVHVHVIVTESISYKCHVHNNVHVNVHRLLHVLYMCTCTCMYMYMCTFTQDTVNMYIAVTQVHELHG